MDRVLVVEDEVVLASALEDGFRDHGFNVSVAHDGFAGYRLAKESEFDVIVLDWMLPAMSGVEVCQRLRAEDVATPILILTAKDAATDETDALDLGADDYLRKPFSFEVLVARCNALLRRGAPGEGWSEVIAGDLVFDPRRRTARRGHEVIDLSRREAALLEYLMRADGGTRSKEQILQDVWGDPDTRDTNLVEVYVGYLRKKLDLPFGTNMVRTVRGKGYRLETP
ncbi:response regulator transcription factor [Aeromicrobium sp.]|uniref:response regulator transcription factor n=1 Tax=Aeromicrobium sp. TaxID=1871063 RepID=UPI003D6B32A6